MFLLSCLLFNVKIVIGANAFLYLAPTQMEDILTSLKTKYSKIPLTHYLIIWIL